MELNKSVIKGSLILMIAFNIFNLLNFVFHFAMVRMMSVSDYGILATLFTMIYIFGIFSESIQIVITKYAAKEKKEGKLKNILKKSLKKALWVSSVAYLFYLAIGVMLSHVLKIDYFLIALNGVVIFCVFFGPVTRGVLQGKKRFRDLGINMITESVLKLILAIVLVYLGWRVYGAIAGTIIGMVFAIIFSLIYVKDTLSSKEEKANVRGIYGYSKPTFFVISILLVFYSIDVFIAKIFFPPEIAGSYAIASILAKTIFFGTQPISKAMFPITAENKMKKIKSNSAFLNAFVMLSAAVLVALFVFYFFPDLIIKIFSGKIIPEASQILFYLGIATSILAFTNILLIYKLSRGNVKNYFYLFLFLIIEIILLCYFSENLLQFSIAFVTVSAIFLWGAIFLMND